ncbi:hypothetical protein PENTCL1PPCAC_21137, partial [Pristionchus entomophagus]
ESDETTPSPSSLRRLLSLCWSSWELQGSGLVEALERGGRLSRRLQERGQTLGPGLSAEVQDREEIDRRRTSAVVTPAFRGPERTWQAIGRGGKLLGYVCEARL